MTMQLFMWLAAVQMCNWPVCADWSPQANTQGENVPRTIEMFNCQDLSNITVGFSRLSYYHEPYLQVSSCILLGTLTNDAFTCAYHGPSAPQMHQSLFGSGHPCLRGAPLCGQSLEPKSAKQDAQNPTRCQGVISQMLRWKLMWSSKHYRAGGWRVSVAQSAQLCFSAWLIHAGLKFSASAICEKMAYYL